MLSSLLIVFFKDFIMNKFVIGLLAFTAGAFTMAAGVGYTQAARRTQKNELRKQCNTAAGVTLEECMPELGTLHTCASIFMRTHYNSQQAERQRLQQLGSRIDALGVKIKAVSVDPDAPVPSQAELDSERLAIINEIENIILDQ
jgi:hypothetical protein